MERHRSVYLAWQVDHVVNFLFSDEEFAVENISRQTIEVRFNSPLAELQNEILDIT